LIEATLKSFDENDIAYCAIATDGSNHDELKVFPVLVQYFDWKNGGIQSKMIEFTNKLNETADTIAEYVQDTLKSGLSKRLWHSQGTTAIQCLKE